MEDHEYPAWLWDILKKEEKEIAGGVAEGDLFGMFLYFFSRRFPRVMVFLLLGFWFGSIEIRANVVSSCNQPNPRNSVELQPRRFADSSFYTRRCSFLRSLFTSRVSICLRETVLRKDRCRPRRLGEN